jgi:O-antigen/teichoic acid export membrane protein
MLRGAFLLGISQVVLVLTGFILNIYLGRTLGPQLYGIFGVMSTFIVINEFLLIRGIYDAISKLVAEKEESTSAMINSIFKGVTIGSFTVGFIYFLFAGQIAKILNDHELTDYIRLSAFIIPITAMSTVFIGALNGLRMFGRQVVISITFHIVRLCAVIIFVLLGFSVKGAIIGLIISDLFKLAMARGFYKPVGTDRVLDRKKILRFIFELMLTSVFSALISNIDLIAVKALLKENLETGLYTSAITISKIPQFLIIPISLALMPVLSKSISEKNSELTQKYVIQSLRLLLIIVLPISLIIMATSEKCIALLYGDSYIRASEPLNILLLGAIFLSIKVVMFNVMVAEGKPRYIIYIGILSLVIDIILLMTLTNRMGLMGAATASAVTHFLGFAISYRYVARKFMIHKAWKSLVRIIAASVVIYMTAVFYSPSGIVLVLYYGILSLVYVFILIVLKEISLMDLIRKGRIGGESL